MADFSTSSPIVLALMSFSVFLYLIGVSFHTKVIKVSRKDREMTWRLDIVNSVVILSMQFNNMFMQILTYGVTDLYLYTGEWFCYTSKFIAIYLQMYTIGHSLFIAILKYIIIVHWERARDWGNEKIVLIFSSVDILHPILSITFWLSARNDFFWAYDGWVLFDRCLGDPKDNWSSDYEELSPNRTLTKIHDLCDSDQSHRAKDFNYAVHVSKVFVCWLNVAWVYVTNFNFLELIVYCQTFRFMKR